jgi:microcystin-dependent protein
MLHISTGPGQNKGVLLPGMSSGSLEVLDSTQNMANGLIIFDEDLQKHYFFSTNPQVWQELDHDWIREDVHGASAQIGQNITLGVTGNVGIGVAAPDAKVSVAGNMEIGSLAWVSDSTPLNNSLIVQTWVGIGTATRTNASSKLNVNGDVRVTNGRYFGNGAVPRFGIIMYSGSTANFPGGVGVGEYDGWYLCNGSNSTPDLRGRFVVGYDPGNTSYNNITGGDIGGAETVTLTKSQLPTHKHRLTNGSDGSTSGMSVDGSHTHTVTDQYRNITDYDVIEDAENLGNDLPYSMGSSNRTTSSNGNHNHDLTGSTGDGTTDGLNGAAHENRPPYFTVAFIQYRP